MKKWIDILPDSISQLSKSGWWTASMWIAAFVILFFMCQVGYEWLAFASCGCLVAVGLLPLKDDSKNVMHYVFAMACALISQVWAGLVGDWLSLAIWWLVYAISLPIIKAKWCFVAEVWCVVSVLITISIYF